MREQWVITGNYWRLPLGVEWLGEQTDVAHVRIGWPIVLLQKQRAAAEQRLIEAGAERVNGKWQILTTKLKKVAERTDELDPERLVEWRPWEHNVKYRKARKADAEAAKNIDEFFHEFCKTGWIMDPLQAELIWNAFARHAMNWMLNEKRPVDFGYFVLHALPYRPNWREIVLAWHIEKPEVPVETWMRCYELLMWSPKPKRYLWSLNVEHKESWWSEVLRYERIKAWKHPNYARAFSEYIAAVRTMLVKHLSATKRVYADFLSQIKRPIALVNAESTDRGVVSRARSDQRGALRPAPFPLVVPYAYNDRRKAVVAPVRVDDPPKTMGDVPGVPAVRSPEGDVRDTGDHMGKPHNETG